MMRARSFACVGIVVLGSTLAACTSLLGDFDVSGDVGDGGTDGTTGAEGGVDGGSDVAQQGDTFVNEGGEGGCSGMLCGAACTDTMSDVHHCGDCATDCTLLPHVMASAGVTCSGGRCAIPASSCARGFGHCSMNPKDGCEADLSKATSCGSCMTQCTAPTGLCTLNSAMAYVCVSSCMAPSPDLCGNTCTNLTSDPNHCSSCNMACPVVTGGNATCVSSVCGVQCNGGNHQCGSSTRCAPDNDVNNCGSTCTQCMPPSGGTVACASGACVASCPGTQQNCNGVCTDTNADPNHCGACAGAVCAGPKVACAGGVCGCPSTKPTFCSVSNTCVDTTSDPTNCGMCGHSCQGGTCMGGLCQPLQIVTPGGFGNGLNGLYGMAVGSPSTLLMSNCLSGAQVAYAVNSDGTSPKPGLGTQSPDYCARIVHFASLYYWYSADDTSSTSNLYYATYFSTNWSAIGTKLNATSLPGRILGIQSGGSGGNPIGVVVAGSSSIYTFSSASTLNQPVTATAIAAFAGLAAGGIASDGMNFSAYVSCPQCGKIVKTRLDTPGGANQVVFMSSGGGQPSILRAGVNRMLWLDKPARKFWSQQTLGGSPGDLTANMNLPDIPDDFLVDGNSIYFWNLTTGRIYVIPADGTGSGSPSPIAHASTGYFLGTVATDATTMYWSESNGSNKGAVWKLAK